MTFTDTGPIGIAERRALTVLAAGMFAEARELEPGHALRERLIDYCVALMNGRRAAGRHQEDDYVINAAGDGPVLRRLSTLMDALALSLGQRSEVARLLSHWSSRILAAVADAQLRERVLSAPPDELLEVVEALGPDAESRLEDSLADLRSTEPPASPNRQPDPRGARVWTRRAGVRR